MVLYKKQDHCGVPILQRGSNPYQRIVPEMESITVTEDGIINLLNKLLPSKAGGPDSIPSRFLRDYGPFLAPAITLIFQASIFKPGEIATKLEICNHCASL